MKAKISYNGDTEADPIFTCGCMVLVLLVNVLLGGMSVNYLLVTLLEKNIPFIASMAIGLFVGEFSIPAAIVVWILKSVGAF